MAVSFLSPSRTTLLISDDALYVYTSGRGGVKLIETVPWDAENFEINVARILSKDCGGKPVLVLNDMVEQHYRKERVMRAGVGALDRSGMLKRKLNVAFPNYPVRAAYPLKEKLPKGSKSGAAEIYIFAALPNSRQLSQSIVATKESLSSVVGLCLLPVEASDMVKALADKIHRKNKSNKSKWVIFMGQHKSGGLRQIVTKNGELALTRMTAIVDVDVNGALWASQAQQELKATMSYLSRFGYHESEGLDVIAIGDPSACEMLGTQIEENCNYTAMTAEDAAKMLKIPFFKESDDRYADILHVTWAGRKNRFILPMEAPQLERISRPRRIAMLGFVALLGGAAFLAYNAFNEITTIAHTSHEIGDAQKRHAQLEAQYQKEIQRKESLGFDVRLVQSSISITEDIEKQRIELMSILSGVGQALNGRLKIDALNLVRETRVRRTDNFIAQNENRLEGILFRASMRMTYPSTADVDAGNAEVRALNVRLKEILPEYKFRITKLLKDYEYVEQIIVESGDLRKSNSQQEFVAEIEITGALPND